MHFRRMEPQPPKFPDASRAGGDWPKKRESYWVGDELRTTPEDMPTAHPWQDRDGEWYWRRALP